MFQDIDKCLTALDQLGLVYVTSQQVQRHSELVVTLRKVGHAHAGGAPARTPSNGPSLSLSPVKLRYYRASRSVMEKASMLYNRFKHAYLLGEGEEVVSASFLRSLLEEKEEEEELRAERHQERLQAVEGGAVQERSDGGQEDQEVARGPPEDEALSQG